MRVPLTRPFFDDSCLQALNEPIRSGWVAQGPQVQRFELRLAAYVGAPAAIACSSGTTALHLALSALSVGPGDEVIVPSFSWVATANVVEQCGARPIFCDIELSSFNLQAQHAIALLSPRTRAIIPVHQFGRAADIDALLTRCASENIALIEDAACALGTRVGQRHAGTLGTLGCFSFHPRKILTTGEGGMVLCQDRALADRLRALRNHGANPVGERNNTGDATSDEQLEDFSLAGFNYRLTDMQAALGLCQLERLDEILALRAARAARYDLLLERLPWLQRPSRPSDAGNHAYQAYVCMFAPNGPDHLAQICGPELKRMSTGRDDLMRLLELAGVSTRQGTHAIHTLPYYQRRYEISPEALPNAMRADRLSVALPLYPQMTDEEQDYVVEQLQRAFAELV